MSGIPQAAPEQFVRQNPGVTGGFTRANDTASGFVRQNDQANTGFVKV